MQTDHDATGDHQRAEGGHATHVTSVLRELQLSSRHELTRWAAERRLL